MPKKNLTAGLLERKAGAAQTAQEGNGKNPPRPLAFALRLQKKSNSPECGQPEENATSQDALYARISCLGRVKCPLKTLSLLAKMTFPIGSLDSDYEQAEHKRHYI